MYQALVPVVITIVKFYAPYLGLKVSQPKNHPRWHSIVYKNPKGWYLLGHYNFFVERLGLHRQVAQEIISTINNYVTTCYWSNCNFYWQKAHQKVLSELKRMNRSYRFEYHWPELYEFLNSKELSNNVKTILSSIRDIVISETEEETKFHIAFNKNKIIRRKKVTKSLNQ